MVTVFAIVWYKPWNYIRHWWFMRRFKTGTTLTLDRLEPGESIIIGQNENDKR